MCEEDLYRKLILGHYSSSPKNVKSKYKVETYKEAYKILEFREKEVLRLQDVIGNIVDEEHKDYLMPFFEHNKNSNSSYNSFINSVMTVDLSEPINEKSWKLFERMIEYLKNKNLWSE